ncbi:MAG: PEP-utilizing enzyme [Chlamydia sp.]
MNSNTSQTACFELPLSQSPPIHLAEERNEIIFYGCTIVSGSPTLTSIAAIVDNRSNGEFIPSSETIDCEEELRRFYKALEVSRNSLYLLTLKLQSSKEHVASDIVMTQRALMQDPWFQSIILEGIVSKGQGVEQAIHQAMVQLRQAFCKNSLGVVSEKYEDIEDILKRLLVALKEGKKKKYDIMFEKNLTQVEKSPSGSVIAFSVSPSFASELSSYAIRGLITCDGGIMSHTAVIMKSLGIPYISGISQNILSNTHKNSSILIIPKEGMVVLNPTVNRIKGCLDQQKGVKNDLHKSKTPFIKKEKKERGNIAVEIQATVHNVKEVCEAIESNADSIGLFRTEYLAFYKGYIPSYEEQIEEYRAIFSAAAESLITFRTFDFSSDKEFFIPQYSEKEFLPGVLLRKPIYSSLLKDQIRAILTAAKNRPFKILFPMITSREETIFCLRIFNEIWDLHAKESIGQLFRPKVGIMVEIPRLGVAHTLSHEKTDFISLGTNDLLQYSLAIDRNFTFATLEDARFIFAHMGFLHVLYHIVQKSIRGEIPLSICGEMAGDPLFLPLLLGFGAKSISVAPKNIEKIRKLVNGYDTNSIKLLARKVLAASSSHEIVHIFQELYHLV